MGSDNLSLSLGEELLRRTHSTVFMLVEATSAYNMILGRPAISDFKVVASTYHQKVKLPVGGRVGEVRGDQTTSRKYYREIVRVD